MWVLKRRKTMFEISMDADFEFGRNFDDLATQIDRGLIEWIEVNGQIGVTK
jgi:hypothetical protein